jgi:hypothetical protein
MLWFGSELSPKMSFVKDLVPNATLFRGGASDLTNALIHGWIHNITGSWELVET